MNNSFIRLSAYLLIVFLVLACSSEAHGQRPVVDAQLRQKLVDNIIRELQTKYVAPEKTKAIGSYLRTKLQSGAYDKIEDLTALASAFTTDLRTAGEDLHLFVTYDPALERALLAAPQTPSVDLQELPPTAKSFLTLIYTS